MSAFKSEAQRAFLKKNLPVVAKEYEKIPTPPLPQYVKGSKSDPHGMLLRGMKGLKK